jgi:Right handed beta helix region
MTHEVIRMIRSAGFMISIAPSTSRSEGKVRVWRKFSFLPAILLLFGLSPFHLSAATFYVDCAHGSDHADGRSLRSAWQHLETINAYARREGFHPGDSILLKRGCRWREQMELSSLNTSGSLLNSGSDRQPITITAYGTGDFPTIDGADLASEWKSVVPGTFVTSLSGPVYKVFVDGDARETEALQPQPNFLGQWKANTNYHMWDYVTQPGRAFVAMTDVAGSNRIQPDDWYRVADLAPERRAAGVDNVEKSPGSWFLDTARKQLYVHLEDGSDPSHHAMQITRRRYGIRLQDRNHIVIEQLRIIHAAKSGVLASIYEPEEGGSEAANEYNTVENCIFWNNGDTTVDVLPGTGVRGEGAIYVAATSRNTDLPLKGWIIQGNAVGRMDSEVNANYDRNGIVVAGSEGLVLRNNYVATKSSIGASVLTDRGPRCLRPTIESNYFTANQGNLRVSGCSNPVVDSNTIVYSYGYGIQTGGNTSGATVTHNLIHDLTTTPNRHLYNGFDCNGGAPNGTLAFNTIGAVWAAEATLEVGCDHWRLHNNVFDSSNNAQRGGLTLYIRRESLPGMKFEQNIYRVDPKIKRQFNVGAGEPGAQTFHDIVWWQANQEPSARNADKPLFMNAASGDYALREAAGMNEGLRDALPVHPFHPDIASMTYLREAEKLSWKSQE